MDSPLTSRAWPPASPGGRWTGREPGGQVPALLRPSALRAQELHTLRQWLAGLLPLRPAQARDLLERAVKRLQLVDEPALHWRATKALLAGDANWADMGFKLALD
jgi:hypothetical protein